MSTGQAHAERRAAQAAAARRHASKARAAKLPGKNNRSTQQQQAIKEQTERYKNMPKEAQQREALLIQPDGKIIHMLTDVSYPAINRTLGVEWIEAIHSPEHTFYLDEEGKLNGQPRNIVAEGLLYALGGLLNPGDYLVGPVIILGQPDEEGDDTDVDPQLVQIALDVAAQLKEDEK